MVVKKEQVEKFTEDNSEYNLEQIGCILKSEIETIISQKIPTNVIFVDSKGKEDVKKGLVGKVANPGYEVQKFFMYMWRKSKNDKSLSDFNGHFIVTPINNYDDIFFKKIKKMNDISFLKDFVDVKRSMN